MKYELSNTIFKRKPTEGTMKKKYPFTRHKEMVKLILDEPRNLYEAYREGLTFKPHPFTEDNLENAHVNCIVLDFDHLTKAQCEFLENICFAHKFHQTPMYGDYSAGTKVRLYENQDIPNYENPKWGYKVFYPVDCLCVWSELNEAFLDAVAYFNPQHSKEQAREVWRKWLKANNNKEKVKDPIFANWILPDVAMLNSYRTQVTYGVRPEQKEDFERVEESTLKAEAKYPCGGIKDYSGLEWKPEEVAKDKEPEEELVKNWADKVLTTNLELAIQLAMQNPNDPDYLRLTIPTSKSMLARRLKTRHFDDLTWDDKANAILNAHMFSKELAIGKAREVGMEAARTLTRNLIEMERQRNVSYTIQDIVKNHAGLLMKDIIATMRQRCGLKVFENRRMVKGKAVEEFTERDKLDLVRSIVRAAANYTAFRARMKLKEMEQMTNPPHLTILKDYARTKDPELKRKYLLERTNWRRSAIEEALKLKTPYTYHKKGLKSWLIHVACVDLTMEELEEWGFEPTKLKDKEEWIAWCRNALNHKEGDLNDVDDEELSRWFRFYRQEYNRKYGSLDGKVKKGRKSKYDELFKDMTKEQIADYIKNSDLHPNMKTRLRGLYIGKRKYDKK